MLRCAGCVREVSEWAARCRACGRPTDDAIEVAPLRSETPVPSEPPDPLGRAGSAGTPDPPDPLDPPAGTWPAPPRPGRGAGAIAVAAGVAAVVVVVVAGTLVGIRMGSSASPPAAHGAAFSLPPAAAAGRIVVQNSQGALVLADPSGARLAALDGLGSFGGDVVTAALDRRYVATLRGELFAVSSTDGLNQTDAGAMAKAAILGGPDTFSNGDQALILVTSSAQPLHTGALTAVTLADGRHLSLGSADEAAGDPQAVGVFVSVPTAILQKHQESPGRYVGLPDSRVELRDAGQPPRVLATAAQLNADLHQDPGRPVHLSVFPDPSGDAVAVELNPPPGGGTGVETAILNRFGQLLGSVSAAQGPYEYSWPSWSPDGQSLAYATAGASGTALAIWNTRGPVLIRTAPDNGARFGYCLWAPDSSAILCPTFGSAHDNWDQGAAQGGPLFSVRAPGTPVVWLPSDSQAGTRPAPRAAPPASTTPAETHAGQWHPTARYSTRRRMVSSMWASRASMSSV